MRCRVIGEGGEGPWLFAARHDAGSIRNPLRVSMPHCGTLLLHAQLHAVAVELDLVQPLIASWRTRHQHRMLGRYESGHGSRWFAGSHVSERGTEPFGAPFPVYESRFQCLFAAGVLDRSATCGGTLGGMRRGDCDEQHLSGSVRRGISDKRAQISITLAAARSGN